MKKIAIIGTGIMGSGMVRNFLKNNYEVYIWNRTKKNTNELINNGAIWVETPAAATREADIIFEITADDQSSKDVWLGKNGIISGASKNKVLIASATLSIEWVKKLISLNKDNTFFDIPVTGGPTGAESGELTLLIGGKKDEFIENKKVLKSIANNFYYFNKKGDAMKYKLLLNALQGIHAASFAEVIKIAEKNNMDMKTVGDALAFRPGGVIVNSTWESYSKKEIEAVFTNNLIEKDLLYAKKFSKNQKAPFLDIALEKYQKLIADGLGNEDFTIIIKK